MTALAVGGAVLTSGPASAAPDASDHAPVGITLQKNRQTITSARRVDLTRDFATLPLNKGWAQGKTVWYVITDVFDANMARRLGINHSPKLRSTSTGLRKPHHFKGLTRRC